MTYKKNPRTKRVLKNLNQSLLDRDRPKKSDLNFYKMKSSENRRQLLAKR